MPPSVTGDNIGTNLLVLEAENTTTGWSATAGVLHAYVDGAGAGAGDWKAAVVLAGASNGNGGQRQRKTPSGGDGVESGRWDSNPRRQPWEGCILPLNYARKLLVRSIACPSRGSSAAGGGTGGGRRASGAV